MSRLNTLETDFRVEIERLIKRTEAVTGLKWIVTSARRTMSEQR